jgi:hypothetical protein
VKHLILVGPAGFSAESDRWIELKSTWKGVLANFIWESNVTPQAIIRYVEQLSHNDFIWNITYIFHKKKLYPTYCIMFVKKRLRKNCGFCGFPPTYNGERK